MKHIRDLIGQDLEWQQPSDMSDFVLRAHGEVVATLCFECPWATLATAESADCSWTFKRVGFWHSRVIVRPCGSDSEVAVFRYQGWPGAGTLALSTGMHLRARSNFWRTEYDFQSADGESLVHLKSYGLERQSGRVTVRPCAQDVVELPLIISLGWYLIVTTHNETRAAAAI